VRLWNRFSWLRTGSKATFKNWYSLPVNTENAWVERGKARNCWVLLFVKYSEMVFVVQLCSMNTTELQNRYMIWDAVSKELVRNKLTHHLLKKKKFFIIALCFLWGHSVIKQCISSIVFLQTINGRTKTEKKLPWLLHTSYNTDYLPLSVFSCYQIPLCV